MSTHRAAVLLSPGQPFEVQDRQTPKPGPGELLIAVKAIALNPADHIIRDLGLFIQEYPTVIGFDLAGVVLEVGSDVPTNATKSAHGIMFEPGVTRVAAYAAFAWNASHPDYGAFQEKCIVPWQHSVPLPDDGSSWAQAATLPVAVQVPLMAWDAMDIRRPGTVNATASEVPSSTLAVKEALLIWGASSSVGTMGVQSARILRNDAYSPIAAVYATAGESNHDYVRSLGADHVFDHRNPNVVDTIISAAKRDGVIIRHCFLAIGDLASCQKVLEHFAHGESTSTAKIASAPPIPADASVVPGIETIFLQPSSDEIDRLLQFQYWMGTWLGENLSRGTIKPSPAPRVVGRGLSAINSGLAMLKDGVSCTKLIVVLED